MKITKRQLRRIIKEEKAKLLKEENEFSDLESQMYGFTSSIEKGSMPMTSEELYESTMAMIEDAVYTLQGGISRVVDSEMFSAALKQVARDWDQ